MKTTQEYVYGCGHTETITIEFDGRLKGEKREVAITDAIRFETNWWAGDCNECGRAKMKADNDNRIAQIQAIADRIDAIDVQHSDRSEAIYFTIVADGGGVHQQIRVAGHAAYYKCSSIGVFVNQKDFRTPDWDLDYAALADAVAAVAEDLKKSPKVEYVPAPIGFETNTDCGELSSMRRVEAARAAAAQYIF